MFQSKLFLLSLCILLNQFETKISLARGGSDGAGGPGLTPEIESRIQGIVGSGRNFNSPYDQPEIQMLRDIDSIGVLEIQDYLTISARIETEIWNFVPDSSKISECIPHESRPDDRVLVRESLLKGRPGYHLAATGKIRKRELPLYRLKTTATL